jgi:AcrR family transcriptional regulator
MGHPGMRDSDLTRERIDAAALRLFVEQGIAETTTRDIAAAARIAEGTIYRHYAGKDELASGLYVKGVAEIAAELNVAADSRLAFREQLPMAIGIFCRLFDERPLLFRYILLQRDSLSPRMPRSARHPMAMLTGAVKRAQARREIAKCDPAVLAAMILGLVAQVAVAKLRGEHSQSLGRLADTLSRAALGVAGLGPAA